MLADPDAGFHTRFMRAYGCGDVCIDLNGCPACPVTVVADLSHGPVPGGADDSAVVFVSCVLEYVVDLEAALGEIARMAGSPENTFIVTVVDAHGSPLPARALAPLLDERGLERVAGAGGLRGEARGHRRARHFNHGRVLAEGAPLMSAPNHDQELTAAKLEAAP